MFSHNSTVVRLVFLLSLTVCLSVGTTYAVPGITLTRTPAPPLKVRNDGASSITFNWSIEHDTTCNQPYKLEILDPALATIFSTTFACSPSSGSYAWLVPPGTPCGCYYGRLTFYSDWCAGSPNKFEDQAWVGFLVTAAATVRICKRWDLNGDGDVSSDPPLQGWQFTIERPLGNVICMGTTGTDGCFTCTVDVECTGETQVWIREVLQPGWCKTTPSGSTNPFPWNLHPGSNPDILVGNWQPVRITGYKLLDDAPWPWTSSHWVGPQGQQNTSEWEPQPVSLSPCFNALCATGTIGPFQPNQQFIPNTYVCLYDNTDPLNPVLVECKRTDANGFFSFGPYQWRQNWKITVPPLDDVGNKNPPPVMNPCSTNCGGLINPCPWPGDYVCTVAASAWPSPETGCPNMDFEKCDELQITIPEPTVCNQEYGCNYFWNRQPSRLWGMVCDETMREMTSVNLLIHKVVDGTAVAYEPPSTTTLTGLYEVPEIPAEPGGIRSGIYRLTPPAPSSTNEYWEVTTYCDSIHGNSTFPLPSEGYVDVGVSHSSDVRVDFCLKRPPERRQCFLPVTLTQEGWKMFCDPNNPVVPGGLVYNKFRYAFDNFTYYGQPYKNKVIIGLGKTITFEGTTSGLSRMCAFFPQVGPCGKLDRSYVNPTTTPGGSLAGELLALQLNIAYNDMRLMPRTLGYDLEKFTLAKGLFKGKTVGEVRNIANAVLGGASPCSYGLANCQELVDILTRINENYEFFSFDVFNDRGYLIPNRPFGQPDPPVPPVVP